MDYNLLVSAQTLTLAPKLRTTPPVNGLMVVKNVPAKTYLRVTPAQWDVLRLFEEPQLVPAVLDRAIRDRRCPRLGEFYELIIKGERAGILVAPDQNLPAVDACDWRGAVNPRSLGRPLGVLLLAGLVLSLGFRPELPSSPIDVALGLVILCAAGSLGAYLRGCLIRGAGGEVYHPRWQWRALPPRFQIDASDAILLPRPVQDVILLAEPAVLAAAAGLTTWHQPAWSFVPLLGLMLHLRPLLGGQFTAVVRLGREKELSDADQNFLFPPNRSPGARWRTLSRGLRQTNTWVRLLYGVVWTLAIVHLAGRLTDIPPWTPAFWESHGTRIGLAIAGSLLLLGLGYLAWESFDFVRLRNRAWRFAFRQWRVRWLGRGGRELDEAGRIDAIARSSLLRALDPDRRKQLAEMMTPARYGLWKALAAFEGQTPDRVGLIVSGTIAVRQEDARKRRRLVQVLGPGDVIGFQDAADPNSGGYRLRTTSPVSLLTADRAKTAELVFQRVTTTPFSNMVLKVPFLRGISLCRHWHLQAVERFAQLSTFTSHPEGSVIFSEGQMVDCFYIIFEGDATVSREGRDLAVIRPGDFFGEIGLLQNSSASATIKARRPTRCLAIARSEFLRFVTHNYAVALELERVSSKRLRRPIFPVRQKDLRA